MRWDSLAMNLQGTLMLPGAPHYERSRRVWNGAIAVCANRADVAATLRFAAEAGLNVAVRGGGHSVGGLSIQEIPSLSISQECVRSISMLAAVGQAWRAAHCGAASMRSPAHSDWPPQVA
jgi:hypothetical protein